jgi:hypothetical protein
MPDDRFIAPAAGDADDTPLRDALRALPLAAPPASALPALQARHARRRRERLLRRWLPLAAAAAVCALALSPLLRQGAPQQPATSAAVDPDLAALIAQNQVYESALRSAAFGGGAQSARSALAGAEIEDLIGMLDLELSAAGDADAARDLWRQRLVLMQELAAVRASAAPGRMTADNAAYQNAAWTVN